MDMSRNNAQGRSGVVASLVAVSVAFVVANLPGTAVAQPAPAEPPPDSSPPPPETAERPPAPPPVLLAVPPAPPPPVPGPIAPPEIPIGVTPKGPVAPAFAPTIPNIDFGGRIRAGIRLQNPATPTKLNDVSATLNADLYAGGQIQKMWRWYVSITTDNYGGASGQPSTVSLVLLDAMATFSPLPEFQITAGRMLVMADRYAPGGPWGLDEWFMPGFYPGVAPPALPKAGPIGRDVGVVAWGVPLGGHIKYYLGAYQLQDPVLSPLISGRLQVSLLSQEPGWFQRTTYYGDRDLISIGVGGQVQKNGSVMAAAPAMMGMTPPPQMMDDFREFNADLIVEKRLGDKGGLSFEGAYYNFHGSYQPWAWAAVGALAYNSPIIEGIGKLRPSFRFQQAEAKQVTASGEAFDPSRLYDVQLTYVVMNWFAHFSVTYRRNDTVYASASAPAPAMAPAHSTGNMIIFGVQLWDP